jgi:sporulation protein YlmC with PRC-barrel domain
MQLEDLRIGASVMSQDGHKLGSLSKFVVQAGTLKLTHVVVDTGLLRSGKPLWKGGWGLSHDRVLPLAAVAHATSARIDLTMTADHFKEHSADYEEEYFEAMPDLEPGRVDLGDVARLTSSIPGEPGPWLMLERRAIGPDEVEIPKDAPVWRLHPHQKIGEVERVIFDETTGKVQDLVIRRGHLFAKDVVLPARHVVEIIAGIVRVSIDDETLHGLPEFGAPD